MFIVYPLISTCYKRRFLVIETTDLCKDALLYTVFSCVCSYFRERILNNCCRIIYEPRT
jgi:hypothetical protein